MDQSESQPRPRLDQQAALDELERFGRDIQRYRAQREALGDEFETFVQSFKTPPDPSLHQDRPLIGRPTAATLEAPAPVPPVTPLPVAAEMPPSAPDLPASAPVEAAASAETVTVAAPVFETPATEISPPAMTAAPELIVPATGGPRSSTPIAAIAAGAVLLLGGGLLAAFLWNRGPATAPEPAPTAEAATTPAPVPAPAAAPATPAPAAAAADPDASEIVTERTVWMRVIADGVKVLEREVPAGTKIPIKARQTIVIRTGDAGAVRLSIRGGPSTALGREGEVVTRSFTVPPSSAPAAR